MQKRNWWWETKNLHVKVNVFVVSPSARFCFILLTPEFLFVMHFFLISHRYLWLDGPYTVTWLFCNKKKCPQVESLGLFYSITQHGLTKYKKNLWEEWSIMCRKASLVQSKLPHLSPLSLEYKNVLGILAAFLAEWETMYSTFPLQLYSNLENQLKKWMDGNYSF